MAPDVGDIPIGDGWYLSPDGVAFKPGYGMSQPSEAGESAYQALADPPPFPPLGGVVINEPWNDPPVDATAVADDDRPQWAAPGVGIPSVPQAWADYDPSNFPVHPLGVIRVSQGLSPGYGPLSPIRETSMGHEDMPVVRLSGGGGGRNY